MKLPIQPAPMKLGATRRFEGMILKDRYFEVPLDYAQPNGAKIQVFGREVVAAAADSNEKLPWAIFFQGGPGFASPRPSTKSGWLGELLKGHRVLLLDQRGNGLSTKVLPQSLAACPNPQAQADYLTHFRADNIVRDAEAIRLALLPSGGKWVGLGQSYGGFVLLTYLSFYPEGLAKVLITGGVACVKRHIDENYRQTYGKVLEKNRQFYERYPEDEAVIRSILQALEKSPLLPSGRPLTARRFQQLGLDFGMSGSYERLHYLLEEAFIGGGDGNELSYTFLAACDRQLPYETNPIFCVLHESIYAQGYATQWAAERLRSEFPAVEISPDQRLMFTGEMISPTMLDEYSVLQPLRECAEILAQKSDWGQLYDLPQLARNEVPVAAVSYFGDMYVPIEWSEETARHIPHFAQWITNEWEHNGLGLDGPRIVARLLEMADSV
jgi:pimeloyl-ACP methyl ester carboxylesterase